MRREELREYFGDFQWWQRPNGVSLPAGQHLDPDLEAAVAELRHLYDAATCRKLVEAGEGRRVLPLFLEGYLRYEIDDLQQLGGDLVACPGWRDRPKLVGELRSPQGWSAARFEVGVQAGLRRAGLIPAVEPAAAKDVARPDFVVPADGIRVGIELKDVADPDYTRNRDRLCDVLVDRMLAWERGRWRSDVTLKLSDAAISRLKSQHEVSVADTLSLACQEVTEALLTATPNMRIALPSIGELMISYPPWSAAEGYPGSYAILPDGLDGDQLLYRALHRAFQCSRQLAAVDVDLRVAVLWGSRSLLPARETAIAAEAQIADDYNERWANVSLDWIIFFNAPTLGTNHERTASLGLCRVPHARGDVPRSILDGLMLWGRSRG